MKAHYIFRFIRSLTCERERAQILPLAKKMLAYCNANVCALHILLFVLY